MKKQVIFTMLLISGALLCQAQVLVKVKETNTAPGGNGYPHEITACGNQLFFIANDNTGFPKLWVTKGADASTLLLGPATPVANSVRNLVAYKNKLYFQCDDGTSGVELWSSDGTISGTSLFADIFPGSSGSAPQHFTVANSKLFFLTQDITSIKNLWVTDGTVPGTIMLKPGIGEFNGYTSFAVLNNEIYFRSDDGTGAGNGLWKSDGTAGGTVLVNKNVVPGVMGGNYAVLNNKLYFSGFDDTNGSELWVTDGTNVGTHIVMNLSPDYGGVLYSSAPQKMLVYNSKIYFNGTDGVHGSELFESDGTTIQLVKDVMPGTDGSQPTPIVFNGLLYIIYGQLFQLWKSDGTAAGTLLVKNIAPYSKFAGVWNNRLYMTNDGDYAVWETDGSTAGTGLIKVTNTSYSVNSYGTDQAFTAFDGDFYFSGQSAYITGGYELVKLTAGTPAVFTYRFSGTGNWSNPANWVGGIAPPATLPAGYSVIINGQCVLDVAVLFQSGSSISVNVGKSLTVTGSLTIL